MRTAFIEQLMIEAENNDKIFLLVGDLGYSVIEQFAERFPNRFINVGIAEQNMAGIAAGLAMCGYIVYIYSIGNFPTLRCIEQIRNDIAYHKANVKIVAVGGGYAYGAQGVSHQATEEIGMLRTIPNMVICAPGDPIEAKALTKFTAQYDGPCYIRLGKAGEPIVHQEPMLDLTLGKITELVKGTKYAIFSTGAMLKYAFDFIKENNIDASLYSFPFVKPLDKNNLLEILKTHSRIITIEEHQAPGGFGSAILEIINDLADEERLSNPPSVKRIAIPDEFYSIAGSQNYLRKIAGLELRDEYFKS